MRCAGPYPYGRISISIQKMTSGMFSDDIRKVSEGCNNTILHVRALQSCLHLVGSSGSRNKPAVVTDIMRCAGQNPHGEISNYIQKMTSGMF